MLSPHGDRGVRGAGCASVDTLCLHTWRVCAVVHSQRYSTDICHETIFGLKGEISLFVFRKKSGAEELDEFIDVHLPKQLAKLQRRPSADPGCPDTARATSDSLLYPLIKAIVAITECIPTYSNPSNVFDNVQNSNHEICTKRYNEHGRRR
jgi:hypothetical protein